MENDLSKPVEITEGEKSPQVRAHWFKGYVEGNLLWPQKFRPGIQPFTTAAVLEDPPDSWKEFLAAKLSRGQYAALETILNNAHEHAGVPLKTKKVARPTDKVITPRYFDALWTGAARSAVGQVRTLINPTAVPLDAIGATEVEEVDRFWRDPANAGEVARVKRAVLAARDGLLEPRYRDLSTIFRFTQMTRLKPQDQERYDSLVEGHKEVFGDVPTDYVNKKEIGQICLDRGIGKLDTTLAREMQSA